MQEQLLEFTVKLVLISLLQGLSSLPRQGLFFFPTVRETLSFEGSGGCTTAPS